MKNSLRLSSLLACLLLLATLLSACSGSAVKLTYENGAYRNADKGMAFRIAPICYRATSALIEDGAVALLKSDYGEALPLYAIDNADPAKWLAAEDFTLYYAEGTTLPSLEQLKPVRIVNAQGGFGVSAINDANAIADLVETHTNGATVPANKITPQVTARYEMVFYSDDYSGILYVLECWRFAEDVKIYTKLTDEGTIPTDRYPGIQAEIVNGEAVFNLGKTLMYDRYTEQCYPLGSLYNDYFPIE